MRLWRVMGGTLLPSLTLVALWRWFLRSVVYVSAALAVAPTLTLPMISHVASEEGLFQFTIGLTMIGLGHVD